jgi:UPF0755 protein
MRLVFKITIFIFLFLIIILFGAVSGANYLNGPAGILTEEGILFPIEEGDTLGDIAQSLLEAKLIKYSWSIVLYSRFMGTESDFKIGVYSLDSNMTLIEIHNLLIEGRQLLYKITIPEGWTSNQIADYLEKQGISDSNKFIESVFSKEIITEFGLDGYNLEGFLYPDTYHFQKNYPAELIVRSMVNNFFKRLEVINPDYKDLELSKLIDIIILASIVEKEYRDPEEAPLMAGVFYNRLNRDISIPLGSSATIVYIITDILEKDHPEFISFSDLEIESPYNTYMNNGLPPGPISNPGGIALKAAFFPENSDYLYFLLKNAESGQHEFTKNLSEHTAAYNLYIKKDQGF